MKIGVDVDDVITNTIDQFTNFCNRVFEEEISYESINDWGLENSFTNLRDGEGIRYAFKLFTHAGEFRKLKKQDRTVGKYINKLKINGHELYFLTARNSTAISDTYRWFVDNSLPINNIYFDKDKEWQFRYHDIDVHVDDGLHNLSAAKKQGITTILFVQPWNENQDHSCVDYVARSWDEVYEIIENL